jgi:hypothetical protein
VPKSSRGSRGFTGLLTAPTPLPDDDASPVPAEPSAGEPEQQVPASAPAAGMAAVAPAGEPGGQAPSRSKPARPVTEPGTSPPSSPTQPIGQERAATTIRLHPPAATALNSAWLNQRMHVNPKLSYPEFASEIVRLGLAAFERKANQP